MTDPEMIIAFMGGALWLRDLRRVFGLRRTVVRYVYLEPSPKPKGPPPVHIGTLENWRRPEPVKIQTMYLEPGAFTYADPARTEISSTVPLKR